MTSGRFRDDQGHDLWNPHMPPGMYPSFIEEISAGDSGHDSFIWSTPSLIWLSLLILIDIFRERIASCLSDWVDCLDGEISSAGELRPESLHERYDILTKRLVFPCLQNGATNAFLSRRSSRSTVYVNDATGHMSLTHFLLTTNPASSKTKMKCPNE
jgi:hypothetical protein